jgi:putative transport protein
MDYFVKALQEHQELAIFLAIATGFFIGRLKIGSFSLGTVVGTLLAGVVIGQLDIKIPEVVKTIFFDLFLFTTGYKVGPQFFRGLKKDALSQVAITVVLCVTCLLTAVTVSKLLRYDVGTAAGLMAGAFTESTVIGTASDAINHLNIPAAEKVRLMNNIPVAYAVSYLCGTALVVWFLSSLGPKLMGVNLLEEGKKLQTKISGAEAPEAGVVSANQTFGVRTYQVTNERLVNKTIAELEALPRDFRVFIVRIRHMGIIIEPDPSTVIHQGDVIAVMTRSDILKTRGIEIGPEVDDKDLLDFPVEILDVVITNKAVVGKSLRELASLDFARGVFLQKLLRAGEPMPLTPELSADRGDVMTLLGSKRDVERAAEGLGYPDRPSSATDMVFVGLGIVIGGLVGLLSISLGGLPITLTASGGALIMGLVLGWLRSVRPTFGRIPEPAMWIFDTVGLTTFIACVGIGAGPSFIAGLEMTGVSLVFVGLLVAVLPHIAALVFGRYVLKMNPLILLGACSGAGTITAALRAIQDEAHSKLPALGYTVPYAIGNILLTAWGPVIVAIMS